MALRKTFLATGEAYHILNRTSFGVPLFKGKKDYDIFLETMKYYLQPNPPTKFSLYRKNRNKYHLDFEKKLLEIVCYCLMPNHFHFILIQKEEGGIRKFIQRLTNSYAHYFHLKYKQKGHLFSGNFQALHVETDEQLIHLSRYLHLNPVTAYLARKPEDYPYSSYHLYSSKDEEDKTLIDPSLVLNSFSSGADYQRFVLAQKDYQRELAKIKHLLIE